MNAPKNTSAPVTENESSNAAPRPTITSSRWTSRSTHPRLVSFSWGAVSPMGSHR